MHMNGTSLALLAAIVAILLRRRAIGGWLLYFFLQVLLGLGLIVITTHWKRYLSTDWVEPAATSFSWYPTWREWWYWWPSEASP